MSPTLQNLVSMHIHARWVLGVPFLARASPDFVTALTLRLKYRSYAPTDAIYRSYDVVRCLLVVFPAAPVAHLTSPLLLSPPRPTACSS